MGFSFLGLLFLQLKYIQAMVDMKKEQFDESVNRALYQASRNLELNETLRYLEKDVNETERRAFRKDSVGTRTGNMDGSIQQSHQYSVAGKDGTVYSSFELKTITIKPSQMPKGMILHTDKNSLSEASKSLQEIVKNRYIYQKALLDEVTEIKLAGCNKLWRFIANGNAFEEIDLSEVERYPGNDYFLDNNPHLKRIYIWKGYTHDFYNMTYDEANNVEIIEK